MKKIRTLTALLAVTTMLIGCESISTPNTLVAVKATSWNGKYYKRGVGARCADWVGYIMKQSGHTPPAGYYKCTNWLNWGTRVSLTNIRPGDVVIYAKGSNGYNHISIYKGGGMAMHRPTRGSTVGVVKVNYRRIIGIRRPPARSFNLASL